MALILALMVSDRSHTVYSNLVLSYVVCYLHPPFDLPILELPSLRYSIRALHLSLARGTRTLPLVGLNYARRHRDTCLSESCALVN